MDKKLKAKWVKALRSGKYKQLQKAGSSWTRDGKHCCLGVLGDLLGAQKAMAEHRLSVTLCGLSSKYDWYEPFIDMNDGHGKWNGNPQSFDQIADFIEKNL